MTWILLAALGACAPRKPELPRPTKQHRQMAGWEGSWDVRFSQARYLGRGTQTDRLDAGGLWLISRLEGTLEGVPWQANGVIGYDSSKGKYCGYWADSRSATPLVLEGDLSSDGRTLVLWGKTAKLVIDWTDKNTRTMTIAAFDRDGKEETSWTATYSRR